MKLKKIKWRLKGKKPIASMWNCEHCHMPQSYQGSLHDKDCPKLK